MFHMDLIKATWKLRKESTEDVRKRVSDTQKLMMESAQVIRQSDIYKNPKHHNSVYIHNMVDLIESSSKATRDTLDSSFVSRSVLLHIIVMQGAMYKSISKLRGH